MRESTYDVCIIGGGAAGIMAAISVRQHYPDMTILLLESKQELGKKLMISGAGRCNLTNAHLHKDPETYFSGNQNLISSVFRQYSYQDIVRFFASLGVPVSEEEKNGKGKIFPIIEHAKTIRDILLDALTAARVTICYGTKVQQLVHDETWSVITDNGSYKAANVILTTGGKTYPSFGSDGSGYDLVKPFGHTVITPIPSAVPLVAKNPFSHFLQGEKCVMEVTQISEGHGHMSVIGDVLFTSYGLSGSAILDMSRFISPQLHREHKTEVTISLNFFPGKTTGQIKELLVRRWHTQQGMLVSHSLWGLVTEKVSAAGMQVAGIPKERYVSALTEKDMDRIARTLTSYTVSVTDTRGWNEAEFTSGGIAGNELQIPSLQSTKIGGLYFAGEIIDVDGPVGGYNLSWAWASGWVAGLLQN